MNYNETLSFISSHFKSQPITPEHMPLFQENFRLDNVKSLLNDIILNDKALEIIAQRSYIHALGFYKIVLVDSVKDLDGAKDTKSQLRLHIWKPEANALPIVESLHEHSFDFISTVLSGKIENQCFTTDALNEHEKFILDRILALVKSSSHEDIAFLDKHAELFLGVELAKLGSEQAKNLHYLEQINLNKFRQLTKFCESEHIHDFISLQGFYKSNRISGDKKAYKHILEKYVSLKPSHVLKINQGEFYYHPYTLPHRLYYDSSKLNATILITTNVANNPEGGSFQRPTYEQSGEQNYQKISIQASELKHLLTEFLTQI